MVVQVAGSGRLAQPCSSVLDYVQDTLQQRSRPLQAPQQGEMVRAVHHLMPAAVAGVEPGRVHVCGLLLERRGFLATDGEQGGEGYAWARGMVDHVNAVLGEGWGEEAEQRLVAGLPVARVGPSQRAAPPGSTPFPPTGRSGWYVLAASSRGRLGSRECALC